MPIATLADIPVIERLVDWVRYPRPGLYEWGEVVAPAPGGPTFGNVQHTIRLVNTMPTRTGVQKVVNVILPNMGWEIRINRMSMWDYEQSSPIEKAAIQAAVDSMSPTEQKQAREDPEFLESVNRYLDSLPSESRAQLFSVTGATIPYP